MSVKSQEDWIPYIVILVVSSFLLCFKKKKTLTSDEKWELLIVNYFISLYLNRMENVIPILEQWSQPPLLWGTHFGAE